MRVGRIPMLPVGEETLPVEPVAAVELRAVVGYATE
jgi:hypothetical protein